MYMYVRTSTYTYVRSLGLFRDIRRNLFPAVVIVIVDLSVSRLSQVRQEVLPTALTLCQDLEADVRHCACRHLVAPLARGLGAESARAALLPQLVELSNDEAARVRLAAVEAVVQVLALLDDDARKSVIVPLVIKSCDQVNIRSVKCEIAIL